MTDTAACGAVYQCILSCDRENGGSNPNDGFCMCGNLSLYQFWLAAEYDDMVYRLPEENAYIIGQVREEVLAVYQEFPAQRRGYHTVYPW